MQYNSPCFVIHSSPVVSKLRPVQRFPILVILGVLVCAFWQVALFVNTMKWDIMDYYLPTRYFMGESLRNGVLPLWCPYMSFGYPFYADPQSGFWYPLNTLIAFTTGYNVYVLQAEFMLHLLIAAWGMYKLLQTLQVPSGAALTAAIVYPLTGFFVAHASHPTLVISMAWMPYVFNWFLKLLDEKKYIWAVKCGVALALCLTGGYVVFFVFACYGLLLMLLYHVYINRNQPGYLVKAVLLSGAAGMVLLVLCSGFLFSVVQSLPYLKRADALSLETVNVNQLTPRALLSFLLPFATLVKSAAFNTDVTMRNIYGGLLLLPLLVTGLWYGNRRRNILLLVLGIICLAAALGNFLPVRTILYYTLPFMKHFRHAAIFRAVTLFVFILIAADGLKVLYTNTNKNALRITVIVLVLQAFVVAALTAFAYNYATVAAYVNHLQQADSINEYLLNGDLYSHVFLQGSWQLLLMAMLILCLFTLKANRLVVALSVIWCIDMVAATQFNIYGTVVSVNSAVSLNRAYHQLPKGFPVPDLTKPVEEYNAYCAPSFAPQVYGGSLLRKEPCGDGFNPFYLKQISAFLSSPVQQATVKHPVVFIPQKVLPLTDIEKSRGDTDVLHNAVYTNKGATDTGIATNASIAMQQFTPTGIVATVNTNKPAHLTVLQNYFPGWTAQVNNQPEVIEQTNYAFMSVTVPAGNSTVRFEFKPAGIYWLWYIYLFSYAAVAITLLLHRYKVTRALN